jgi:hypothetical protein
MRQSRKIVRNLSYLEGLLELILNRLSRRCVGIHRMGPIVVQGCHQKTHYRRTHSRSLRAQLISKWDVTYQKLKFWFKIRLK